MGKNFNTIFGILLIVAGLLLGAQQLGYLGGSVVDALFTGIWALGAIYFANLYMRDRAQWWFALVAFILASLTLTNLLDLFVPRLGETIGGAIFLGAIGAGFLVAYARQRANWWAIIPAGVLFTLAIISIFNNLPSVLPFETGALLFFGIGLTFLVISLMKIEGQRFSWALIPAIVLLAFGFFVGFRQTESWNYIWPSLIILFGAYFLISSLRKG